VTAAGNAIPINSVLARHNATVATAPEGNGGASAPLKPLTKQEVARGYSSAFFLLRELVSTKAHLIEQRGWEILVRVTGYVGCRYNEITLGGTEFAPKPWTAQAGER